MHLFSQNLNNISFDLNFEQTWCQYFMTDIMNASHSFGSANGTRVGVDN